MSTTQVTIRRSTCCRTASDVTADTTDLDPRPSAEARARSWRSATELRDGTTFWSNR